MKNYEERLKARLTELKEWNCDITDITSLYSDFTNVKVCRFNYVWRKKIRPFAKQYKSKRTRKGDFNQVLFSKIIYNNLYGIRQYKDDLIPYGYNKESDIYKYLASHQYVRRELEHLEIDDIIVLSYALAKTIK